MGSTVVALTLGFLYIQGQPTTAGSDPVSANSGQEIADLEKQFGNAASESPAITGATASESNGNAVVPTEPTLVGNAALQECDRLLAEAQKRLEDVASYTATFVKQERIGGTLSDIQMIQMRMWHQPMRVFMRWENGKDAGQRVIFAADENDGEMMVRMLRGLEARLGVISLSPESSLAMKHSRYPVTKVGLLELTKIIREHVQTDIKSTSGITAKLLERQPLDGRDCLVVTTEYAKPELAPDDKHEYRKTMVFIDSQTKLPICIRCYGWPETIAGSNPEKLDQTTLLELYAYKNIDFGAIVKREDFSKTKLQ